MVKSGALILIAMVRFDIGFIAERLLDLNVRNVLWSLHGN
jgi:hypothetical protein